MSIKIALAGNPNSGKRQCSMPSQGRTSLWETGRGVTVEKKKRGNLKVIKM